MAPKLKRGWQLDHLANGDTRIWPVGDIIVHDTTHDTRCQCRPDITSSGQPPDITWQIRHHPKDRRTR